MEGITVAEKDHSVVITVETDVVDRKQIDQALTLLESNTLLDEGLVRAMEETEGDEEFDLEEAKRIIGRK